MVWKVAKGMEDYCNTFPQGTFLDFKTLCFAIQVTLTKSFFIIYHAAVIAYQTAKTYFETTKIGAGDMWTVR